LSPTADLSGLATSDRDRWKQPFHARGHTGSEFKVFGKFPCPCLALSERQEQEESARRTSAFSRGLRDL
jgi:hypothetical protein